MIVANAECEECEAPYLAWIDGINRKGDWKDWGSRYPMAYINNGVYEIQDLSHRHAFNDEPSELDYPKYRIVVTRTRVPWVTDETAEGGAAVASNITEETE